MKTAPLYRYLKIKNKTGKQPHVLSFVGTRADESLRRSTYAMVAKDAKHTNVINVSPILEWNTTEIWLYLLLHELPYNMAYRMGLGRVGCLSCPFGSDWNDYLCNHLFRDNNKPFIDKLREYAKRRGIKDTEEYIGSGNWKIRGGGTGFETTTTVSILSLSPDFIAVVQEPKENVYEWIKTIGKYTVDFNGSISTYQIHYHGQIYTVTIEHLEKDTIKISSSNCGANIQFVSHLRRVINKVAHCVHCEMCEVDCPSGALSVVPMVHVDATKCTNCHKCLDYIDNGCISASSIKTTNGNIMNSKTKKTFRSYNNFGFRNQWLEYYLSHIGTYFENNDHGLNIETQLKKSFVIWLREAEILEKDSNRATDMGKLLSELYLKNQIEVWEIIWAVLCENSGICKWYSSSVKFEGWYSKNELDKLLELSIPECGLSTRKNALNALQNTLSNSPLGKNIGVGRLKKEDNNIFITRISYNDLSLVSTAYSLYRYAEKNNRYDLTVSEFYNTEQKEGIYRQFGIERDVFESNLRSLEMDHNHVLRAELKMGLDNIILRKDLTSLDVLKMLI